MTPKDRLLAHYGKGMDSGDWILLTWLASFFVKVPTVFWVFVWIQFSISMITQIKLIKESEGLG